MQNNNLKNKLLSKIMSTGSIKNNKNSKYIDISTSVNNKKITLSKLGKNNKSIGNININNINKSLNYGNFISSNIYFVNNKNNKNNNLKLKNNKTQLNFSKNNKIINKKQSINKSKPKSVISGKKKSENKKISLKEMPLEVKKIKDYNYKLEKNILELRRKLIFIFKDYNKLLNKK